MERCATAGAHENLPRRRAAGPGRESVPGDGEGPRVAVLHLWGVQRDLRARDRVQPRPGRLHARVLHAVWDLPQQRHRGRLGIDCAGRGAFQASQPETGHGGVQHRRRLVRLRSGVGRHHVLRHGPVPQAMGCFARGRLAHHFQLHEQFLWDGRPAVRRDHGSRVHRAHRRGRQPGADARGARQRLRSPAGDRRLPAQAEGARGGPRAGPAGHDYVPHQRPLAVRRFELPLEGRSRALAGGRFDPRVPEEDGRNWGGRRERAGRRQGVHRRRRFRHVPPGRRSGGQPARGARLRTGGLGDVLEPASGEVRRPAARVFAGPLAKSQGAADQGEGAHGNPGWETGTQDEGVQHSRRHLRGSDLPLRDRPHHGGFRRGESRLGRRFRGLSRLDRGAAVPSAVQLADFRGGDCRRGRGIRARGRPGGGGTDVCRLHGPRGR